MKIISGGQTGADQAGLFAALDTGIETGGFAPSNYMTLDGPRLSLRDMFHLKEIVGGYAKRTYLNVQNSDCTLRFAFDFGTPGERCTMKAIERYNKPYKNIDLTFPVNDDMVADISHFIIDNEFDVINVAGNANRKNRDSFTPTYNYMIKIIQYIRSRKCF